VTDLLEVRGLTVELPTGKFVEVGSAEQVLHQPKDTYARELLAAVPALPTP